MKIIKYEKKTDNKYQIYLENDKKITIHEDVILKNKLLFKKEIDAELLETLLNDNENYDIYNKCVKYISVRLRSVNEIKEYMQRKNIDNDLIIKTIDKLTENNLLNDEVFTKAFIKDKLNFTTMGPYRVELELKKHHIDTNIINKYIHEIDYDFLEEKINKQINKLIKNSKNKPNLKNKIYHNLLQLGYPSEIILKNLNKYF